MFGLAKPGFGTITAEEAQLKKQYPPSPPPHDDQASSYTCNQNFQFRNIDMIHRKHTGKTYPWFAEVYNTNILSWRLNLGNTTNMHSHLIHHYPDLVMEKIANPN